MMQQYIVKRLCLIVPTLLVIVTLNFFLLQWLPGGPLDAVLARMGGMETGTTSLFESENTQLGSNQIDARLRQQIAREYGFDQPLWQRYTDTLWRYLTLDLGQSYFSGQSVAALIKDKLPTSFSIGFWSLLITYLIAIPLGVWKALNRGGWLDAITSFTLFLSVALPTFIIAVLLMILFAGGGVFDWFPLRGLVSAEFSQMTLAEQLKDYAWHIFLPVMTCVAGGLAPVTMLIRNSVVDQLNQPYVETALSIGESRQSVLFRHVLQNSLLVLIARIPADLLALFVGGALLVEIIFSLDGVALLAFESLLQRDYPVVLGIIYVYSLLGLFMTLLGDILYRLVDPRMSFEAVNG
ncbi:ABC transporter permease subunit [Vibrio mangrovi]|uniref:ABC transporter permease subunit n=1 Tax=Vibrio mangrovi TaxID=474394 RepID=A0A1Y6IQM5_9VIBR|nr:ABC transporter permease subunit [Vibrio mangrovi]MDW6003276.1 ABC transporter permease subunit [Vibrio mangrovi]SMR99935.1 Inner membrane ABC transporter permease protein YejB [Vibrio mangrovi]